MQIEQIITELIKVGGQLGIFGFASYFIQKSIDTGASKRLEQFKKSLDLLNTKETSLHTKRLSVMETMYQLLVDLDYSMRTLTNPLKFGTSKKRDEKLMQDSQKTFQDFNMYFEKNKIYFSLNTCKVLDHIRKEFYSAIWDYNQPEFLRNMQVDDGDVLKEAYKRAFDVYNKVKDEFPILRTNLETEFRTILNVC